MFRAEYILIRQNEVKTDNASLSLLFKVPPWIKNPIFYIYNYSYIDIIPCGEKTCPCRSLVNNIIQLVLPDPDLHVLDQTVTPSVGSK